MWPQCVNLSFSCSLPLPEYWGSNLEPYKNHTICVTVSKPEFEILPSNISKYIQLCFA
ncbi:hypothetical protein I79_006149 [Cricetulus griseus]|uniref:Uncharacterized protein n=1 Tax=Cricetulus griseus TaxID=10029 RepID=G3H724_CRIGR|nr:hypothetical protein I79_006149 [Cricetulus griseus]